MELKELMKEAGIVGAGGAGFPAYAKLAPGADILLVNGAECEPLLYTDYIILSREMPMVLAGIKAVLEYADIPRALLCVKEHTAKRLNLKDGEKLADRISLKTLPDVYNGAAAVKFSAKVTMKWLTIGGNIPEAIVVRVPVGTPVSELFAGYSITVPEEHAVLDGGPSMGKIIDPERAVVTKTTKALLILPEASEAVQSKLLDADKSVARAETACCQCTRCTDMCPRALLGYPLEPHKMVRTAKQAAEISPAMVLSASLCCGCGVCESLACCQGISPKAVIAHYKDVLAKNKLRYVGKGELSALPEREYRMIPSSRWAGVLGVGKYDKMPVFKGENTDFDRVEIYLKQHIGAPSKAIVADGQKVERGDKIAESADGLSLPQYASVSGYATVCEGEKIIIDKVNCNV